MSNPNSIFDFLPGASPLGDWLPLGSSPSAGAAAETIYRLTITTEKTGYTWQRVYTKDSFNNSIQKLVPTYKAKLEQVQESNWDKVVAQVTSIDVTRDGWYGFAQKDNSYHLINTAFEPVGDLTHFVGKYLNYEHSGEYALKCYQSGSEVVHAQPYPNATSIGRDSATAASGVMVHVGGVYYNSYYKRYQLGGSLGCFGVIVGDNKITKDPFNDKHYVSLMTKGSTSNSGYRTIAQRWKSSIDAKPLVSNGIKGLLLVLKPRTKVSRSKIGQTANGYYNTYWADSSQSDIKINRYSNFLTR